MPFIQSGCAVSEYSWEGNVPQLLSDDPDSAETILYVSFDHGAQHLFSSVRICVCCDVTANSQALLDSEWKFAPRSSSPLVTPASSLPLGHMFNGPNKSPLPVFNAIFKIQQIPNESDIMDMLSTGGTSYGPMPSSHLMLMGEFQEEPRHILFEINQPLTADTQCVSVPCMGSLLLYTAGLHGSGRFLDGSFTVGRIVRVQPVVLPFNHKTTHLPTEILLMIFESFCCSSQAYKRWRSNLLSCALVCKRWSCALSLLLSDFRYPGAPSRQSIYPPEICSFANALALRPSLGLSITHLALDYFLLHPSWKDFRLGSMRAASLARLGRFTASLSAILRHAKNIRSLSLSPICTTDPPEELLDALRRLDKLEEVNIHGISNTPHHTYPYLAMWPTLKRLTMQMSWFDQSFEPIPTSSLGFVLTEATLSGRFGDEHLNYILSSSSSSLERLTIYGSFLTNGGLCSALQGVAKSVVTLEIKFGILLQRRDGDEERALDSVIVHMERLKSLSITLDLASDLMIKRRAEAFKKSRTLGSSATLPLIKLTVFPGKYLSSRNHSLAIAAASVWPGWEIKIPESLSDQIVEQTSHSFEGGSHDTLSSTPVRTRLFGITL